MGVNVFPAPSGASLPPGATALVAAGYAEKGFTNVTGNFPAGKYLVRSNSMSVFNFSNAKDVIGYQNSIQSVGGEAIVNVPVSCTNIDFVSGYAPSEYRSFSSGVNADVSGYGATPVDAAAAPATYRNDFSQSYSRGFTHNGRILLMNSSGIAGLSNQNAWDGFFRTTTSNLTSWSATAGNTAGFDGTTIRGYYQNGTNFSTTSITSTTFSTNSTGFSDYIPNIRFGGGLWIQYGNQIGYKYSTNGTSWSSGTFPIDPGSERREALAYGNGRWVLTSFSQSTTGTIAYSSDGISWTTINLGNMTPDASSGGRFAGVAFGGGIFMALASSAVGYNQVNYRVRVLTSRDGINWVDGATVPGYISTAGGVDGRIIHDGISFVIQRSSGSNFLPNYRSYTGQEMIAITGGGFNGYFYGAWGKVMSTDGSQGYVHEATKTGTYFEVYAMDSSKYPTY